MKNFAILFLCLLSYDLPGQQLDSLSIIHNQQIFQVPQQVTETIRYDTKIRKPSSAQLEAVKSRIGSGLPLKDLYIIPEVYKQRAQNGKWVSFSPYIISHDNLEKNEQNNLSGEFTMILVADEQPSMRLNSNVLVEFGGSNVDFIPENVHINHTNGPLTKITVETDFANDSIPIRIITSKSGPKGYDFFMKVRPFIEIIAEKKSIQGMGIEEIPITVRFRGSSSSSSEQVVLHVSSGDLERTTINLPYNQARQVKLRSSGLENISIHATSNTLSGTSNNIIIKQQFPWMFLVSALLGGIVGILIRNGYRKDNKQAVTQFLAGTLMGLIAALAYYVLGVNFLQLRVSSMFNEFAVFTFSALSSLFLNPFALKKKTEGVRHIH
ncbi:hypothetical protein [Fulvivirga sedimenti]|uniref:Uncharacterized protein n=1 Tax=Fulvivirga sedimenti TaxID=2879465 RepID=A0A9X1HXF6_9BACT|nr:hypothetical protein [Fulvivirga sedimenti]MCA6079120.1 hypothetical protein [Fulvivirga sedimenti]